MLLYVIEGISGSGKDTLQTNLRNALEGLGKRVIETRDPGITDLGRWVYDTLHGSKPFKVTPFAASYLYLAARAELIEYLTQFVEEDVIILQNRWTPSTIAYQRLFIHQTARDLHLELPVQRVFWINTPPDIALERMRGRSDDKPRKLEQHQHDQYLKMYLEEKRWHELDGMLSPEMLVRDVMDIIGRDISHA